MLAVIITLTKTVESDLESDGTPTAGAGLIDARWTWNRSAVRETRHDKTGRSLSCIVVACPGVLGMHLAEAKCCDRRGNSQSPRKTRANADRVVTGVVCVSSLDSSLSHTWTSLTIKPTVPGTLDFTYHHLSHPASRCHKRQLPPPRESVFLTEHPLSTTTTLSVPTFSCARLAQAVSAMHFE